LEASFLVLQGAEKQDVIALARLVRRLNLPHIAVEWPELRKLLVAVNNTMEPEFQESWSIVLRLIEGAIMEVSKPKEARCQVKAVCPVLLMFMSVQQEMILRRWIILIIHGYCPERIRA
jgi:hypothetical protein